MAIPFVDLRAHHARLRHELDQAWHRVVERGAFVLGDEVADFEAEFAAYVGTAHAVGVNSGLDALTLGLRALGLGAGDEVILPANTFIATALAVTLAGGQPVLVDCREDTALIDPEVVAGRIGPRTRAIVPVHLYGRPCDLEPLEVLASRHGLSIVEDACQAHGAAIGARKCGALGRLAAFSFYPGKNIGALGDGGILVTDDGDLALTVRQLRSCGERVKYDHVRQGVNSRLDALHAAMLRVKLPLLDTMNALRAARARQYDGLLAGVPGVTPLPPPAADLLHVYHLYVVRVADGARDDLRRYLAGAGIDTQIHYPVPIHLQAAYAELGHGPGAFPVAERLAGEILSLPMYPELTPGQVEQVAETIAAFAHQRWAGAHPAVPGPARAALGAGHAHCQRR